MVKNRLSQLEDHDKSVDPSKTDLMKSNRTLSLGQRHVQYLNLCLVGPILTW